MDMYTKHLFLCLFFLYFLNIASCLVFKNNNGSDIIVFTNLSSQCQKEYDHYMDSLQKREEWALRMYDATGRQESGVLDGNYVYEGRYEECNAVLESNVPTPVKGLYCIAYWYPLNKSKRNTVGVGYCIPHTCTDEDAYVILQEVNPHPIEPVRNQSMLYCVREKTMSGDAGAIVSLSILCIFGILTLSATLYDYTKSKLIKSNYIPGKSNSIDLKQISNTVKNDSNNVSNGLYTNNAFEGDSECTQTADSSDIQQNVHSENEARIENDLKRFVQPDVYAVENNLQSDLDGDKMQYTVDTESQKSFVITEGKLTRIFLSFSLCSNVPEIVSIKHSFGPYQCLHSLRFLAMIWIVLGHTYEYGNFTTAAPVVGNRWTMFSFLDHFTFYALINWSLSVETFFILGAVDVTAAFMKEMECDGGKLTAKHGIMYFVSKYVRRTPVYMIVLMFYTNLFKYLGSGPFFLPEIPDIETCKDIWWEHLLYIQNLFTPFVECMAWSSYMPLDFQFHVMAFPFVLIACWKPAAGIVVTIIGLLGSLTANIYLNYDLEYNRPEGSFYDEVYVKPWTRSQTYFMGMLLGYFLYKNKSQKFRINKYLVLLCWIMAICLCITSVHIEYTEECEESNICGHWDKIGHIIFYSLQRPMFACCVIWIIFACETGNGGIFKSIFCWKIWIPLSRLSYVGYLIHPLFVYYFAYSRPVQLYYYHWMLINIYFGHVCLTMSTAIVVSALFEVPMGKVEEVLVPKS